MRRMTALIMTGCLGLSACMTTATSTPYELSEFAIAGPETLDGDMDYIDVVNSGELPHTLVVTDPSGRVVAATGLIQPGEATTLDVDLSEGRYTFTCRIVAETDQGELVDHFEEGMNAMVSVRD